MEDSGSAPDRAIHPASGVGRDRVAVIGSGVSGLTAAYVLHQSGAHVTLWEAQERLGGHAHTHDLPALGRAASVPVDTGFIVHNDRTYPILRRLFGELGVSVSPTEMSMSIRDESTGIEYAGGRGVSGFLARPRQLLRRDYVPMLLSVRRFHEQAAAFLADSAEDDLTTYGDFIERTGLPESFVRLYAVPLVACVWSTEVERALDYPAKHLFAFLDNHGMLSIGNSPQWFTVDGGSRTYVEALAAHLPDVRRATPVRTLTRGDDGVEVIDQAGRAERFDRVVIATHPDEALALLADATTAEKEVMGSFTYTPNETVLHRDPSLLPSAARARASWNYILPAGGGGAPIVTYDMNRLQGLPAEQPAYVTLNAADRIDPSQVIATMNYAHPLFDVAAVQAQKRLPELTTSRTAFAGAYHGWGFHEDGARSGVAAARAFGATW